MIKGRKKNHTFEWITGIVLLMVVMLTIGWSAFSKKLYMDNISMDVRVPKDIRITDISASSQSNSGVSNWEEYNVDNIQASLTLPNSSSTVTYKIQITNLGSEPMGIYNITGLPDYLFYRIDEYNLGDKICVDSSCNLGVQKYVNITIGYKETATSNKEHTILLNFEFRPFYEITYSGFTGSTASYPQEIMSGATYKYTFTNEIPRAVQVEVNGTLNPSFTYQNGNLVVENVTGNLKIVKMTPFATDDWNTIKENSDSDIYKVGDTREIELEGLGTYTLRIANKSRSADCEKEDFSQTACGFVVEFEDVITDYEMNSSGRNAGGWPASSMKEYLDSTIYPALPKELQDVIIETKSISGHGSDDIGDGPGDNFVSTDRLYLLSPHEIWENGSTNEVPNDTAWDYTRQLDYYYEQNTTTDNYSPAIKKNSSNSASFWWSRGAEAEDISAYYRVNNKGDWSLYIAEYGSGVSPAFRISSNKPAVSFATDDWSTIKENSDSDVYQVGDTREIDLGNLGIHTLRIANKSTPESCQKADFSQTACGFVVEFKDIITTHVMNSLSTNGGGWPKSSMKEYFDSTIYNALPGELQAVIIETKSISCHGDVDKGNGPGRNFVSNDKLYLLSPHEVWENGSSNKINSDTAWNYTRQLDYYFEQNTTTTNYSPAIKRNSNNSTAYWWLRGAYSLGFYYVTKSGEWDAYSAFNNYGVSPAFRIG